MGGIIWRLAYLQIARHEELAEKAARQRNETQSVAAIRGTIVDRNNIILATSIETRAVMADLFQIEKLKEQASVVKAQIVQTLAGPLRTTESALAERLNSRNPAPILAARLDWEAADQISKLIEANNLKSIKLLSDTKRHYPNGPLAAHVLGTINGEERGISGLERQLEKWNPSSASASSEQEKKPQDFLNGEPGKVHLEKDATGRAFFQEERSALAGARVITTLDVVLQHKVEQALAQAFTDTQADGISAIVMDPATGEILALANAPTFEPGKPREKGNHEEEEKARRNRAIADVYETGSVLKMVTYAAVIEEGLARPDEKINCRGPFMNGPYPISDVHPYGELTVAQALAKSSNVGTIRLALRLKKEQYAEYLNRFGFGQKTEIDLPFERTGVVPRVENWGPTSLPSMSIGYGVSVTALQAVAAMASIANHGVWVRPHLVKRIVSSDASARILWEAQPVTRQVVSAQTADIVKDMLAGVVENGTARNAVQLASYTAGGKTGTAKKVVNGRYSDSAYYASFAGFVPATNPRFAIIVVLDSPKGAHQGGQVAAPIFNQIAQAALGDYGVLPDMDEYGQKMTEVKDTLRAAPTRQVEAAPSPVKVVATPTPKPGGKPTPRLTPTPQAGKAKALPTPILKLPVGKSSVRVEAATKPEPVKQSNMPNVIGRSLREAASLCSQAGLKLKAIGSGVARSQRKVGDTLVVEFR